MHSEAQRRSFSSDDRIITFRFNERENCPQFTIEVIRFQISCLFLTFCHRLHSDIAFYDHFFHIRNRYLKYVSIRLFILIHFKSCFSLKFNLS